MKIFILFLLVPTLLSAEELHEHPTIQSMLRENNRLRFQVKLAPNAISPSLTKAAQNQAQYMARTHDFEHKTTNNGTPGSRAAEYGYAGTVRENIGRGLPNISEVFERWKKSPSHWESITGNFDEAGFGYAIAKDGTKYWVALYGSPQTLRYPSFKRSTYNFLLISL